MVNERGVGIKRVAAVFDDWSEPSVACALSLHERCLGGKCACDCHEPENAAMRDALAKERSR